MVEELAPTAASRMAEFRKPLPSQSTVKLSKTQGPRECREAMLRRTTQRRYVHLSVEAMGQGPRLTTLTQQS